MFSDDLFRLVAVNGLSPCVPGDHVSFSVEKQERMVAHILDDGPYLLVLAPHGFLCRGYILLRRIR